MKTIYFFVALLALSVLMPSARGPLPARAAQGTQPACCVDFNDNNLHGWSGQNVNISLNTPGPSGQPNDIYLHARDLSGASFITAPPTCTLLANWTDVLRTGCGAFCFDLRIFVDGCDVGAPCDPTGALNGHLNITPSFILISDPDGPGGNPPIRARFLASFTVTENGGANPGWHHLCAALALLDSSGNLPTNNDGSWQMLDSRPNSDWNTLLTNVTEIQFPVDFTANPAEEIGYDNFCLRDDVCQCMRITNETILCPTDGSGNYTYTFNLTNLTNGPIKYVAFIPTTPGVTVTPNILMLPTPLGPNQTTTVTVTISGSGVVDGAKLCFIISIHNEQFENCCSIEHCVTVPDCKCVQITRERVTCQPGTTGTYTYTFDLTNLFPANVKYIFLVPLSPPTLAFTPNIITLTTPLPQGQTTTLNVTITGAAPGTQICFRVAIHDTKLQECCSIVKCLTLPMCPPAGDEVTTNRLPLDRIVADTGPTLRSAVRAIMPRRVAVN
jgi:hypothetical protein